MDWMGGAKAKGRSKLRKKINRVKQKKIEQNRKEKKMCSFVFVFRDSMERLKKEKKKKRKKTWSPPLLFSMMR